MHIHPAVNYVIFSYVIERRRARCECFLSLTLVWLDASTRVDARRRAVWTGLKAQFGYLGRVTPICRCLHPFCGWRHLATSRESKAHFGLPWVRHRNMYASIFNRLLAIARYWSEIATFSYPLHLTPPLGVFPLEFRGNIWSPEN